VILYHFIEKAKIKPNFNSEAKLIQKGQKTKEPKCQIKICKAKLLQKGPFIILFDLALRKWQPCYVLMANADTGRQCPFFQSVKQSSTQQ